MQRRTPVTLGIDAGTTSLKTVAFGPDGRTVGAARRPVDVTRDSRGAAEADMDAIWSAAVDTIRETVARLDLDTVEVVGIGITGQGDGAWLVDRDGRPTGPAALWLDGRASDRLREWHRDGRAAAVQSVTRSPLFPGALPLLLEEFRSAHDGRLTRAAHHLNCKDWLRFRLTGTIGTDPSEASRTFLDTGTGCYAHELVTDLGLGDLGSLLAPVNDPSSLAGGLLRDVADEVGLPSGVPVAVGMVDTAAAGVGLGATADGDGYGILGTTGFIGVNQPSIRALRDDTSIVLRTGRGTQVLESLAPMTGTPNLDRARATLRLAGDDWREIERQADEVPAGSGGVVYLPYGSPSGERAPFTDLDASASWHGTSITTTPAQLLRSVYEGVAFSLVECLDVLGLDGDVAVCGGGSESDLVCRVLADASGRTITRRDAPEVGARGVAALANVATGSAVDLDAATASLQPASTVFHPDSSLRGRYDDVRAVFTRLRDAVRDEWPALRALREESVPRITSSTSSPTTEGTS